MKKVLTILALVAIAAVIGVPMGAFALPGTLYEQEGGTNDQDIVEVNAAGVNGSADANYTNWKHQYGGGSWSGVYSPSGWVTASEPGSTDLKVEADVEMYFTESVSKNNIYFHLGNIYSATDADKTAYVDGSFSTNNGQWIGISFPPGKLAESFEKVGTDYTGRIIGGMQSNHDTWRDQDNQMDVEIKLSWGTGWQVPGNYGEGAHGTIQDTLWWLVADGVPGTYNYQWRVRLLPTAHQADGDYYLDPVIVASPVL